MTRQSVYRIAVLVILVSQVGSVMVARADTPAFKTAQAGEATSVCYLPLIFSSPGCPDYFDNFSNPSSGWYVGEDNKLLVEYLEGEYRVMVKRTNSSRIIDAPTCNRQDFTVEVDARWAGVDNMGVSYGLMVRTTASPSQYYFFEVSADTQKFTISHYGQGGWEPIIGPKFSEAIHAGTVSNHLKITHNGNSFTAEVNGFPVHTWVDITEPGEKGVGLIIFSYPDQGNADARFDNFRANKISG